jgi:hypothetical protein
MVWAAAVKVRCPGPATRMAADTIEARDFLNIRVFLRELSASKTAILSRSGMRTYETLGVISGIYWA